MERGKRLGEWVDATFKSRAEAARQFGMAPSQLGDYLAERKAPGADILATMAARGLDVGWYLTGVATATTTRKPDIGSPMLGDRSLGTGYVAEPGAQRAPPGGPPPGLVDLVTRALDAPLGGTDDQLAAAGLSIPELAELGHAIIDSLVRAAEHAGRRK